VLQAFVLDLPDLAGVFIFIASIFALALLCVGCEILVFQFRDTSSPLKLCHRLNVCCGYHYDLEEKPVPEFWLSRIARSRRRQSFSMRSLAAPPSQPFDSTSASGQSLQRRVSVLNPVHSSQPLASDAATSWPLQRNHRPVTHAPHHSPGPRTGFGLEGASTVEGTATHVQGDQSSTSGIVTA
jgi:hypothetical protein